MRYMAKCGLQYTLSNLRQISFPSPGEEKEMDLAVKSRSGPAPFEGTHNLAIRSKVDNTSPTPKHNGSRAKTRLMNMNGTSF